MVARAIGVCARCLHASATERPARKLLRPLVKSVLSGAMDANVCVSDFAMRRYRLRRKQRISCGVDTQQLRPGNEPALFLYRREGFRFVGVRKGYYVDTGEDAVVLLREIGEADAV